MDKNIFDKRNNGRKKVVYYILMGICVAIIAAAAFISYNSIQDAIGEKTKTDDSGISNEVDTHKDDVTETKTETEVEKITPPTNNQNSTSEKVEKKKYLMPVSNGEVTNNFSLTTPVYSNTLKDWRIHDGIDISGNIGDVVVAVDSGAVEKIESNDLFGITVTIKHIDGKKSIYCNLEDSVELEEGQLINQGDTVGKIGKTALFEISDGPHLHFEMTENGEKIDPLKILKGE